MRHALHDVVDRCGDALAGCGGALASAARRAGGAGIDALRRARGLRRHEPLPRRPLVAVAAAVVAGSAAGPVAAGLWPPGGARWAVLGCWAAAGVAFCGWGWLVRAGRSVAAAWLLLGAIAAVAAGWSVARERLFRADDLAWSLTETPAPVAVEGVVVESLRVLPAAAPGGLGAESGWGASGGRSDAHDRAIEPASECVVALERVRAGGGWRPASGRAAVVVTGEPPAILCGCRVRIVGRGLRPAHAANPGEFDFRERARALRCLSIVRARSGDCIRVVAPPAPWSPAALLDRLRRGGAAVLDAHVGRRAGLAAALLLGSREALPADDAQAFLVTGTVHILSISGLHVGILAFVLSRALRATSLRRSWALAAVAVVTGLYMLLVGGETPVVRATLLVWLSCLAAALGRRSPVLNALAAAAIVVLVWQPADVFRVGTQLSFVSTAVLVGAGAFAPSLAASPDPIERLIEGSRSPLERRLRRLGRQAAGVAVTGAAVWLVTAPVVAARFHLVSPVGLVLNPLLAPLVPLAMVWGFLCLVVAPVSTWLAAGCGAACDATLVVVELLAEWAARLPGAYVWVAGPAAWWVAGWYAGLVAILVSLPRERLVRPGTWAAAAAAWAGVGLAAALAAPLFDRRPAVAEVTVAALGHGCGVVIRSPTGRVIVCDAGRLGAPAAARRGMSAVLWDAGVGRIDTLVVSHADTDHFNAVPDLLERFSVGRVAVSEAFLRSDAEAVRRLLRLVYERRIPVVRVDAGDDIPCDHLCRVRVLHHDAAAATDNETSLVLAVESAGRRLLLTGDLEGESLARFVAAGPDACDVILAPHHGSATSLPADIARATRPDWVVVSGPGGSRWGEVRRAYETARGARRPARVVKTGGVDDGGDPGGAVRVSLDAAGVAVRQFSAGRWRSVPPPPAPRPSSRVASATRPPPGGAG